MQLEFAGVHQGARHADCAKQGAPASSTVSATLESGPFYARSLIDTQWFNEPVTAVHESLSLTRFANPIEQGMLPFRMPRRSCWTLGIAYSFLA